MQPPSPGGWPTCSAADGPRSARETADCVVVGLGHFEEDTVATTLGVDIGGTKIAVGAVDEAGRIMATSRRDTPADDPAAIEDVVVDAVKELLADHRVSAVGVAAAGFIAADRSTVRFAPNIAWRERPLGRTLSRRLGVEVIIENDANAAAWAEYRYGAGRGHEHVVMLTLGTGLGGGVVIDGRLLRGEFGISAEIGHVRAVPDGLLCGCGNLGCWEQYISGNALVDRARERVVADSGWSVELLRRAGGDVDAIAGPLITDVARDGDRAVVDLLSDYARDVGVFCASMVAVLDPGVIVVGGGVSAAGDLLLTPAREAFAASLPARGHRPQAHLALAELGNEAGLVGVADLARTAP